MDQLTRKLHAGALHSGHQGDTRVTPWSFDLESDISLSEDPAITFGVLGKTPIPITVEVHDSAKCRFPAELDLPANGT